MSSTPDPSTPAASLEVLQRAVTVANRRAVRRTVISITAVALVVLLGLGGLAFLATKTLDKGRMAYSYDESLAVTRGGFLINNHSREPITRLVNELVADATFSADGHIALTTQGPYSAFSLIMEEFFGLEPPDPDEIFIFDSSGERIAKFQAGAPLKWLRFSPDSKVVLAIPRNGAVTVWSLQGQLVATIKTEGRIHYVAFSPNGNYVLVVPRQGAVTVSNLQGQVLVSIKTEQPFWFAAFSPEDSHYVVVATTDGTLLISDISSGRLIRQIKGPNARALVIGFQSGGQQIAVVYADAQVKVWDVESGSEVSSGFFWTETMPRAGSFIVD